MSYVRKKILNGRVYAYEVTAVWDPIKKRSTSTSRCLGVVDENGNILSKGTSKKGRKPKDVNKPSTTSEKYIKDFGNGFLLNRALNPLSFTNRYLQQ